MASISSTGIGSGIDINSLVSQLVDAQKQPQLDRLDARETTLKTRLSSLGTLKSALASLQDSAFAMWKFSTFNSRSVSSSDPNVLTVSASAGAVTGRHQIALDALAQEQRLSTDPDALTAARFTSTSDTVGTGTLTFRFGTVSVDGQGNYTGFAPNANVETKTVEITDGSVQGVASAINGAHIGVTASVVFDGNYYRLVLSGNSTGVANGFEVSAADNDGTNTDAAGLSLLDFKAGAALMQQTQAAKNTQGLVVDGIAISSASNTLEQAVAGLTINLLAPGSTTVTVGVDQDTATKAISDFVDKYNALISTVNDLSHYDAEKNEAGPLLGDSFLFSVDSQIRRIMGQVVGSSGDTFRQLADIGITRNPSDGTLVLDADRLNTAMATDYDGVAQLANSYGKPLDDLLSGMLSSVGSFKSVTDSINASLSDIADQRDAVQQRSDEYQARLTAQFTAMDTLVAQLRSTSDYLTQQFTALQNSQKQ